MKTLIILSVTVALAVSFPDEQLQDSLQNEGNLFFNPYKTSAGERRSFSPYGHMMNDPRLSGSYGPYARYGQVTIHEGMPRYGQWNPYTPYGRINMPYYRHRNMDPYDMYRPYGNIPWNPMNPPYGDNIPWEYNNVDHMRSPYDGSWSNSMNPNMNDDDEMTPYPTTRETNGFTPYSKKIMFYYLTRGIDKMGKYAKIILGRITGLENKIEDVCPETEGAINYVPCLVEAYTKVSHCMRPIAEHPRFYTCIKKQDIKSILKEFYVHDFNWHKQLTKCLAISETDDKFTSDDEDFNVSTPEPFDFTTNKGVETMQKKHDANTRQCFTKLHVRVNRCNKVAKECTPFKKCYGKTSLKKLMTKKEQIQMKFVKSMDICLQEKMEESDTFDPELNDIDY